MKRVEVTYHPHSDPKDGQPGRFEKDTISAALVAAYELRPARPWNAIIEIRLDGQPVYDRSAAADAVRRISDLVDLDKVPLEEAAGRVATKDGHS